MKSENCDDDDSAFVDDARSISDTVCAVVSSCADDTHTLVLHTVHHSLTPNGALLLEDDVSSTVDGNLSNVAIKEDPRTMHIVIHNADTNNSISLATRSLTDSLSCPPTTPLPPMTPLPPPTPSTPHGRSRGFRYQWESSAFESVIPVRCKSSNGELHKSKFGSGSRGKSIKMNNVWYTPNEFEAACGRSSSKDWKRSIHYGGRTLQCLIEDGLLIPHAACCSCAACSDDESVSGPVRWFIPYKRKKRDGTDDLPNKRSFSQSSQSSFNTLSQNSSREGSVSQPAGVEGSSQYIISGVSPDSKELLHVVTADQLSAVNLDQLLSGSSLLQTSGGQMMSPNISSNVISSDSLSTSMSSLVAAEASEQKSWVQLEEMANSLQQQVQGLKELITAARRESIVARESALQQLRVQLDVERRNALQGMQIESQMILSKALADAKTLKDIALQEALAQARAELLQQSNSSTAAGVENSTVCSTCDKNNVNLWSVSSDSERDCEADVIRAAASSDQLLHAD